MSFDSWPALAYSGAWLALWWLLAFFYWGRRRRILQVRDGDNMQRRVGVLRLMRLLLLGMPFLAVLPLWLGRTWFRVPAMMTGSGFIPIVPSIPFYGMGSTALWTAVATLLVPLFLSQAVEGWMLGRSPVPGYQRRDANEAQVEFLTMLMLSWPVLFLSGILIARLLGLGRPLPVNMALGVGLGGGALVWLGIQRLTPGRRGRLRDMDDTPLRGELERMCAAIDIVPKAILVEPVRDAVPGEKGAQIAEFRRLYRWWLRFRPTQPIVPLEVLRVLPTDSLTAVLATRFASHQLLYPRWIRRRGRGALLAMEAGFLFAFVVALSIFVSRLGPRSPMAAWGPVFVLLPAVGLVALAAIQRFRASAVRDRGVTYERALEIWRAAAPREERTGLGFVRGLVHFNRALSPTIEREAVVRLMMNQSKGMRLFFEQLGLAEVEATVRAAIAEIDADRIEGAGAEASRTAPAGGSDE